MKIVALYARVSSKKQEKENTIESQIAELKDRISNDGHELLDGYEFKDKARSGSNLEREGLDRLRDEVAEGKIDKIYIHSLDRLSRDCVDQKIVLDEFKDAGVEIIFLNHKVDDTPESGLLTDVSGAVARYELRKIMERSRRGKLHAAKKGSISVMANAPYGYRYIKRYEIRGEGKFEINEEEAEVVRKLFIWIGQERVTIRETVRRLKEMCIMTQTGREVWNPSTIHKMLKNPAYKGLAAYGKTKAGPVKLEVKPKKSNSRRTHSTYSTDEENWIYIPVPQIIGKDLFNVVQEQLIENKQRARVQQRKETYLLQKLVVCKCCGRSYCGKRNYSKEKKIVHTYYNCLGTRNFYGNKVCTNRSIRGEVLETVVLEKVKSLLKEPERIINEYRRRLSEYENNGSQDETFEKQESKIKRCIAKLIDGYAQEYITKEEFEPRVKAMRQRLKAIEEQKEKMLDQKKLQQELNLAISSVKNFSAKIESNLDQLDWQAKRGIIKTLVKQIEINLDDVDIVWKIEELTNPPQEKRNQNMQHCRRILDTGMTSTI